MVFLKKHHWRFEGERNLFQAEGTALKKGPKLGTSLVLRLCISNTGAWVQSLVRELYPTCYS